MPLDVLLVVVLFFAVFLTVTIAVLKYLTQTRYEKFILKNSTALKQLDEINGHYEFYPFVSFDQEHTYDNENFFDDISCKDYLIYQLQFIRKKAFDQIEKMNINDRRYSDYLAETEEKLQWGQFGSSATRLNHKKFLKLERKLVDTRKQHPSVKFCLEVKLHCSTINGRVYAEKSEKFFAKDVIELSRRLNNKRGNFFNDRGIWDAICRVERGKVSNKMRFSIYQRDGYRCRRCGASGRFSQLEVDHIIPIAKGGKSTYNNLQTLCHRCNVKKGDSLENY